MPDISAAQQNLQQPRRIRMVKYCINRPFEKSVLFRYNKLWYLWNSLNYVLQDQTLCTYFMRWTIYKDFYIPVTLCIMQKDDDSKKCIRNIFFPSWPGRWLKENTEPLNVFGRRIRTWWWENVCILLEKKYQYISPGKKAFIYSTTKNN